MKILLVLFVFLTQLGVAYCFTEVSLPNVCDPTYPGFPITDAPTPELRGVPWSSHTNTNLLSDELPAIPPCVNDTTRGIVCPILKYPGFTPSARAYFLPDPASKRDQLGRPMFSGVSSIHKYRENYRSAWALRTLFGANYVQDDRNHHHAFYYQGLAAAGRVNSLTYHCTAWKGHFVGNKNYIYTDPIVDGYTHPSADNSVIYLDNLVGAITLDRPWYRLELGRGSFQTGEGISGSVILSDWANDYNYLQADLLLDEDLLTGVRHTALVPDYMGVTDAQERFLASHYIAYDNRQFRLEFGEQEIYGNRGFDLGYTLPVGIWRIVEHNLHDRDNAMLYFASHYDLRHTPLRLYANLMIDEWRSHEIIGDWWGDKWAVQTGLMQTTPDSRWRWAAEIVAVRPWTYTHYQPVDRFTHDGRCLGYPDGSNLVQCAAEMNYDFSGFLTGFSLDTHHSYKIQGSLGSNVFQNYNTRPKDTAGWLEDDPALGPIPDLLTDRVAVTWRYNVHHTFRVGLESTLEKAGSADLSLIFGWRSVF
jgi:hypothetical protein